MRILPRKSGPNRPLEAKPRGAANKGRVRTAEHQGKIAEANRGKLVTEVTRAKQSTVHKGRVFSAETREKIAAAKRGKPRPDLAVRNRSPDGRAQTAALHEMARGRERPDLAARNASPEQRAAVSAKLKGRRFSMETLARMSAAQRRRWGRED